MCIGAARCSDDAEAAGNREGTALAHAAQVLDDLARRDGAHAARPRDRADAHSRPVAPDDRHDVGQAILNADDVAGLDGRLRDSVTPDWRPPAVLSGRPAPVRSASHGAEPSADARIGPIQRRGRDSNSRTRSPPSTGLFKTVAESAI